MLITGGENMKAEDIILTDSSRGMDKAAKFLPDNYCSYAARDILQLQKGTIFLITGFWVNGTGETDGPAGTYVIYKSLEKLGYNPIILTEAYSVAPFENLKVLSDFSVNSSAESYEELINKYSPVAVIAIERCGRNSSDDYTNIRGESIKQHTSNLDLLFELCCNKGIVTVGIGDGGNEIGMGNISENLRSIINCDPCKIKSKHLIVATVSNWGAYALVSNIQRLSRKNIMPHFSELKDFYKAMVNAGFVDGITGKNEMSVDGFDIYDEKEIYELLKTHSL